MSKFNDKKQDQEIKEMREKGEEAFVKRVAERFEIPYINLTGLGIETDALKTVKEHVARGAQIAPFKITGKKLCIAMRSPNLTSAKRELKKLQKKYKITKYLASTKSLNRAWDRYVDISKTSRVKEGLLNISSESIEKISEIIKTNNDVKERFIEIIKLKSIKQTSSIMELIFGSAIALNSSDVHIETQKEKVRLRFRQDGVLYDILYFDKEIYSKLLSRIKLLSEMKLTRKKDAQDGRFTIDLKGDVIEIRSSVIPSAYGESVVMRILNPKGIQVSIEELGIEPKLFEILSKEINKPNGLILTTGPTGSGKTTTLYSFLRKLYTPEKKILTIEDPIEYHLEGISQTQVDHDKGFNFLNGLRAAVRQDPDIIMVGEIRDNETARIAVNASLTGHLVLSTLHTNNAAGVIPRLLDLGVSSQILAAALSVSMAQRLVRRICKNCKKEVKPTKEQEKIIRDVLKNAEKNNKPLSEYNLSPDQEIILWEGGGCEICHGIGYKGRIGIFEAIITDEYIEKLLNKKPSEQEVRKAADKQGIFNMQEDGIVKILRGDTSFEEVAEVVDLELREYRVIDVGVEEEMEKSEEKKPTKEKVSKEQKPSSIKDEVKSSVENVEEKKVKIKKRETTVAPKEKVDEEIPAVETYKEKDKKQNPSSVLDTKSIEIALLIDFLKKLEDEQMINPNKGAYKKIEKIQKTIINILKNSDLEKLFKNDESDVYNEISLLHEDLERLKKEQEKNPKGEVAKELRTIRQTILNL